MGTNVIQWSNFDDQVRYQPIAGILPGWTPADITTALWLDADDASTITEVTGVSIWADKSGNSRDVTQVDTAKQPLYNSTTKTITFDGIDDYLASADFGGDLSQPLNLFAVGNHNSFPSYSVMVDGIVEAKRCTVMFSDTVPNPDEWAFGSTPINGSAVDTLEHIFGGVANGASSSLYLDGNLDATGNVGTQALSGITVGAIYLTNSSWLDGAMREILLVEGTLSTTTRQLIEGYLAWKWDGINLNTARVTALPAGHPYKSSPPTA